MGFFNKLKLSLSGAEGQMESNILNALDYIKREFDKNSHLYLQPVYLEDIFPNY